MSLFTTEQKLSNFVKCSFLSLINKGPDQVEVEVYKEFIKITAIGVLTKIEKSIMNLSSEKAIDTIIYARELLYDSRRERFNIILSEIVGSKVYDIDRMFDFENDKTIFILILEDKEEKQ